MAAAGGQQFCGDSGGLHGDNFRLLLTKLIASTTGQQQCYRHSKSLPARRKYFLEGFTNCSTLIDNSKVNVVFYSLELLNFDSIDYKSIT
jgi:hypothetical protein